MHTLFFPVFFSQLNSPISFQNQFRGVLDDLSCLGFVEVTKQGNIQSLGPIGATSGTWGIEALMSSQQIGDHQDRQPAIGFQEGGNEFVMELGGETPGSLIMG